MKKRGLARLLATLRIVSGAIILVCLAHELSAQGPPQASPKAVQRPPALAKQHPELSWLYRHVQGGISLIIDGIEPAEVWANQDFVVDYTVLNETNRTINGTVSGTFAGGDLVPVGSAAISNLPSAHSAKGQMRTNVFYGPSAGAYRIIMTYGGGEQHCVPKWPSGQICLFADSAMDTFDVTVKGVGEILVGLDPLPPQAQAGGGLCRNGLYPLRGAPNEWETTPNGLDVPVSGRVVNISLPGNDVPWDHPFGCDYWFNLLPDVLPNSYWSLLNDPDIAEKADCSPSGLASGKGDGDLCASFRLLENERARADETYKGLSGFGVLHTEMEDRLVPPAYRASAGDRVYMRGKRIIDCGHNDYTSELHPPTIFAKASLDQETGEVASTLLILPYRTFQTYQPGNLDFNGQFASQVAEIAVTPAPVPINFQSVISNLPSDQSLLAHYRVSIPTQKGKAYAAVQYHFVVRPGVNVSVKRLNNYQADVEVSYDPNAYVPPLAPVCVNDTLTLEDADKQMGESAGTLRGLVNGLMPLWVGLVPNPMIANSLDLGASISACVVPGTQVAPFDPNLPHPHCQMPVSFARPVSADFEPQAPGSILDNTVSVNPAQPFPAYGWLDLKWGLAPVIRRPPPSH